jgi:hypothetical protein
MRNLNPRVIEFWDTKVAKLWLAANGREAPEADSDASRELYLELCQELFPDDENRVLN